MRRSSSSSSSSSSSRLRPTPTRQLSVCFIRKGKVKSPLEHRGKSPVVGNLAPVPPHLRGREQRRRRRGETDGRGGGQFPSPLGASQHYSTDRSDRDFYLSPWPICAVGLKFSPRKVFWIIGAAILIRLPHHRAAANGGGSLSGVPSPSSSYLERVHPEYTCCNRDIPRGAQSKLSK